MAEVVREFLFVRVTFEQSPKWGEGSETGESLRLSGGSQGLPELSVICDQLVSGSVLGSGGAEIK